MLVPKSCDTHRHKCLGGVRGIACAVFFIFLSGNPGRVFTHQTIHNYCIFLNDSHPLHWGNNCHRLLFKKIWYLYLPTICGYPLPSYSHVKETANLFDIAVISTGHYLFIETSFLGQGSKAWLIGPKISPQAGKCFQFWYHMYGSSIGYLNVYLLTTKTVPSIPTWSRQKNHGNQWYIAQVSITQNSYVNVSWTSETELKNGYIYGYFTWLIVAFGDWEQTLFG